jgi:predicted DNA-binding ribbon-helix-helix protein
MRLKAIHVEPAASFSADDLNHTGMTDRALRKRSMRIAGHRTSLALEDSFWEELERIARASIISLPALVAAIEEKRAKDRPEASLASAVRVFALLNRP